MQYDAIYHIRSSWAPDHVFMERLDTPLFYHKVVAVAQGFKKQLKFFLTSIFTFCRVSCSWFELYDDSFTLATFHNLFARIDENKTCVKGVWGGGGGGSCPRDHLFFQSV